MSAVVDLNKYYAFLAAMFLMAISPGPANMFFVRIGLARSYRRVFLGVIGVNLATLVWFIAAAFGLQVIMITVPLLFQIIAIGGGVYLAWISLKSLYSAFDLRNEKVSFSLSEPADPNSPLWSTFRDGFMVQLLNPKVTLFFTAVLPPFLDIHRAMPAQMAVFAVTSISMDILSMTSYGLGAVTLSHLLTNPKNKQRFDIAVSLILLSIAGVIIWHSLTDLFHI
ncbi:LysE family translocator [Asticcacaulis sp. 201]|uniref:LysE family translocator n=1 Tax=Asticcacaulis sp. 201 TaxID=3028787 RepID=UPI0029164041|nr:LysE family translocator [Asticcacaulis sp. 201]MDV6331481.1 LysE family translocator [Asticcacaulis sp. 201]